MSNPQFNYPPVNCKADFVRRYTAGEFGNASPTWNTITEFADSGYNRGLIHIRNRVAGGPTWYNVKPEHVGSMWTHACINLSCPPESLYISAMAPTEKTTIQGEVQLGVHGTDLFYTTVAKPMREALIEDSYRVQGVMAGYHISAHLCPNSREWLMVLLERYPNHVIEFSSYSVKWGTLPGFNTVFWEVRNY